jgi:hypothetical protein
MMKFFLRNCITVGAASVLIYKLYRVSKMKRPDCSIFPESKEHKYGLMFDKYQSYNTPSLILKINTLLCDRRWGFPTIARDVA